MTEPLAPATPNPRAPLSSDPAQLNAFKQELLQLIPQIRAFARFLCQGDRAGADDLAQEALARAWQARDRFEPGSQMRAWLFVIVRNLYYSDRRKAWRSVAWDAHAAERTLQQREDQGENLDLDDVRRAMHVLADDQRDALILVTAGGLSYEEAAQVCGCAVGTIKSRVNRARKALLEAMETGRLPPRDAPANDALSHLVENARRLAADS